MYVCIYASMYYVCAYVKFKVWYQIDYALIRGGSRNFRRGFPLVGRFQTLTRFKFVKLLIVEGIIYIYIITTMHAHS